MRQEEWQSELISEALPKTKQDDDEEEEDAKKNCMHFIGYIYMCVAFAHQTQRT